MVSNKQNRGGRPAGRRNAKPSAAAVANYYRMLQDAADSGSVQAAGTLIELHERRCSEQSEIKPSGV